MRTTLLGVFLLGYPQIISGKIDDLSWIPLFSVEGLRSYWYLIVPFLLIDIAAEVCKIVKREYTLTLANICAIATAIMLTLITIVFTQSNIINPEFIQKVASVEQAGEVGSRVLRTFHWSMLGVIYIISIVDVALIYIKALGSKKVKV